MEKNNQLVLVNSKSKFTLKKENIKLLKNVCKFIVFDIFVILIFFITSYNLLLALFLINLVFAKIFNIKITYMIKYLAFLIPLIGLSFLINIFAVNIEYAFLIMTRLLIACMSTYIFSKTITTLEISRVIETILFPLTIFKIDVKSIGLLVSIAISFIPILKDELFELKQILDSKGYIMNPKNMHIYIRPLIISIFKRTNDIEKAIIAKGYSEVI